MRSRAHVRGRVTGPPMGFAIKFGKPFATQSASARAGLAGQAGAIAMLAQSGKESLAESALAVAQSLWSRGNLSPLDALFSATAIVKLVPTSGFGFIGNHLGHRLQKYADDLGVAVDAAEAEPTLTRLYAKSKTSIRSTEWNPEIPLFKKSRHQAFIVMQANALRGPLETVYGQSVAGLKRGGRLFAADLMVIGGDDGEPRRICAGPFGRSTLCSFEEHASALEFAGFHIESRNDLTENFLSAVRSGLLQSLDMLEELCAVDKLNRIQRIGAFAAQLEAWKGMYDLAAARKIEAACILATRAK